MCDFALYSVRLDYSEDIPLAQHLPLYVPFRSMHRPNTNPFVKTPEVSTHCSLIRSSLNDTNDIIAL